MSFEGEYASYEPLRRLRESAKVQEFENQVVIHNPTEERESLAGKLVDCPSLPASDIEPDLILAFDGGELIAKAQNGYPGAELGYITVASVLIDIKKVGELQKHEFISPREFRTTEKVESIETVFPGCNVVSKGELNARTSLRRRVFEEFGQTSISFSEETLLDTYEHLLQSAIPDLAKNPPSSPIDGVSSPMKYAMGEHACPTSGQALFSTDALRVHELLNDGGSSGEMFGQIRSATEKLWLVHVLRAFEKRGWLSTLKRVAFIVDGPLAVFSTSAWLSKPIAAELKRINEAQKVINGNDMLIIGIEKSGTFFNHFVDLDTAKDGTPDWFPRSHALLLNDPYIKKHIRFSDSDKPYGIDTYFGRKIFYKAKSGQILVANLAHFRTPKNDAAGRAYFASDELASFPRLRDATALLDKLVSNRYPNSVSPLVSAHAEAAIPMNLGKRIFDDIAREIRRRSEEA
ncbi:MAG TPA: DNA double-strand break repair nuclease NurA [Pyrinomonadaceae bacterium]|nr:DNA double-strand break repair nuclease NurA [Pyrinomonadaceae bacterium]